MQGEEIKTHTEIASQEKDGLHGARDSLLPPDCGELEGQMTPKMGPHQGAWPRSLFIPQI